MTSRHNKQIRIVLLCDNAARELSYLLLLKTTLENKMGARVFIVGSVAEIQRAYYYLNKIKPQVVIVSQIVEDSMRKLALYVKKSGALLFVLPPEVLVIPALTLIFSNPSIKYNHLLDAILLPGDRLKQVFTGTDISKSKLKVVGTPKVDVLVKEDSDQFFSRKYFLSHLNAPANKKNIIIFTSFITIPDHYMKKNESFKDIAMNLSMNNKFVEEAKRRYSVAINKLCRDFPNYNIILKPHPLEKNVSPQSSHCSNFFIAHGMSFYNCLHSIDIAIHWSSTIAPECWLKGIKTIQFLPHKDYRHRIVESWPGNPTITSYALLNKALRKYEDHQLETKYLSFQKKYLLDNFYKLDGKSCERISLLITKMLLKKGMSVHYTKMYSFPTYLLVLLEKMLGITLSRICIKMVLPGYKWSYAVNNYVLEGL